MTHHSAGESLGLSTIQGLLRLYYYFVTQVPLTASSVAEAGSPVLAFKSFPISFPTTSLLEKKKIFLSFLLWSVWSAYVAQMFLVLLSLC